MKGVTTSDDQHMQHLANELSTYGNEDSTMSTLSGKPSPVQLLLPRKRLKLTQLKNEASTLTERYGSI